MRIKDWFSYLKHRAPKLDAWQKRHPTTPLREFYAEKAERKLRKGRPHRTLGGKMLNREFGISGKSFFDQLVAYGLTPQDVCVDYGCGTLRIGIHLIEYLEPGRYWGLDVSDFLLDRGRDLIGESLLTEKRPNLRVISEEAVEEVAAMKPRLLISNRVLTHVQPEELREYFSHILRMIGANGQAVVTGKWSAGETRPARKGKSWAYALPTLRAHIEAEGGRMEVLTEKGDAEIREGSFRIEKKRP
jgi:ubiquinone/menaquinone biosynthesis C-methylase UbiE